MAYVDFTFYGSSYGGSLLSAVEFPALERQAALHVDRITVDRLHQGWPVTDAVKMAVCAVAEAIKRNEAVQSALEAAVGLASENNDGYGVTYRSPADARAALDATKTEVARPYLIYTGLMDRSAR